MLSYYYNYVDKEFGWDTQCFVLPITKKVSILLYLTLVVTVLKMLIF